MLSSLSIVLKSYKNASSFKKLYQCYKFDYQMQGLKQASKMDANLMPSEGSQLSKSN